MKTNEEKFSNVKLPGIPVLVFNLMLSIAIITLFCKVASSDLPDLWMGISIAAILLLFIFSCIAYAGLMQIEPNEARVMIFFGKYEGTVKENGFFWVNPFYAKKKLLLRARNLDAEPIKVNDKNGNPIMIGQVIVWKVVNTYKASFDIDNAAQTTAIRTAAGDNVNEKMKSYEYFVKVQSDAALRMVAGMYA
jgi:regulator of protease activity HflC (stomatin/prohibitin superfamily)